MPVLLARVGKERVYSEAVESHIGGWFRNAAVSSRIRPVEAPEYDYELPTTADASWRFTATVAVQPPIDLADWTKLEVPGADAQVPEELVQQELDVLRYAVAELAPVEGRPAAGGDTAVVDLVSASGEAQRDYVVEIGSGRLVEELEAALVGMSARETKEVGYELADDSTAKVEVTVKELKEKVLPPLDDDLARAASEFDSLEELRADIERRLREQIEDEVEGVFRAAAVDSLVESSGFKAEGALVDARATELLRGLLRSLERRGISAETYLAVSNQTAEQLQERLRAEAAQSVARELVLEAVADKLGIEVSDEEIEALVRDQVEEGEDADAVVERMHQHGAYEQLREDIRLRNALDRVAAEVSRIPVDLARAREKLWTPGQEKGPGGTKLWIPGQEERQ
jgi:trigger factor